MSKSVFLCKRQKHFTFFLIICIIYYDFELNKGENMQDKIVKIIAKQLNKKIEDINFKSRLVEDLGADSLDVVELLMTFEEEYNIIVPDEDAVKFATVGDIVRFLDSRSK